MTYSPACMLFQGEHAHPAHQTFGNAIGVEYRHFETGLPPQGGINQNTGSIKDRGETGFKLSGKYNTVIAEGSSPLQTLLSYKLTHPNSNAIYLAADETFYTLNTRKSRYIWKTIKPVAARVLDSVVSVSKDAYEWARPYIGDHPYRIVHPPISNEKYSELLEISPSSPSDPFRILTVGEARKSKQLEYLVQATKQVASKMDDEVELVILGRGHSDQWYSSQEHVRTPGFIPIEEFVNWFEESTIYIQPSQGDSYPVASLEAMLAATPTVVTQSCGTHRLIPEDQVTISQAGKLADKIKYMSEMSCSERKNRGCMHRESVQGLTEETQQEEFKSAITDLVSGDGY